MELWQLPACFETPALLYPRLNISKLFILTMAKRRLFLEHHLLHAQLIRKLMKLLVIASFQINFFDLACCFFRNKIYSDIEIWSPLLKRPSNFSNLESYFLLAVFVFKSKVSIQVIWKMIQWRFCAANQQVLILKFASRSWKFPGFLRNRPLEKHNSS